jgi:hypothetical protein
MSEEYELDENGYPIGSRPRLKKPETLYELDENGYPIGSRPRLKNPEESEEPLQEKSSFKPSVSTRLMLEAANFVAGGRSKEEYIDMARVGLSIPVGTSKLVYDIVDSAQSQFTEKEWGK